MIKISEKLAAKVFAPKKVNPRKGRIIDPKAINQEGIPQIAVVVKVDSPTIAPVAEVAQTTATEEIVKAWKSVNFQLDVQLNFS